MSEQQETKPIDYSCVCGKKYKSYAAIYTHVKLKHEADEKYFKNMTRPSRKNEKRGRPKKAAAIKVSDKETEKLCIVEELIIKIFQDIKDKKIEDEGKNILLAGNTENNLNEIVMNYDELVLKYGNPGYNFMIKANNEPGLTNFIQEFITSLSKHFKANHASKIIWVCNSLSYTHDHNQESAIDKMRQIWGCQSDIFETIHKDMEKWIELSLPDERIDM